MIKNVCFSQVHVFTQLLSIFFYPLENYIYTLKLNDSCFDSIELWLFFNGEKDSG